MHGESRADLTEYEPFLDRQHDNDIELNHTEVEAPNDAADGGDHYNKFISAHRASQSGWRLKGQPNDHGFHLFGHRISKPIWLRPKGQRSPTQRSHISIRGIGSTIWQICAYSLMTIGALQCFMLVLGLVAAFFPDRVERLYRSGRERNSPSHWPTDFTADILPVKCHSHNDYWRTIPVFSALEAGCTGIEADVWLYGNDLFVGHTQSSLTPNRTLKSLYINPLMDLLRKQNPLTEFQPVLKSPRNGVFDTNAEQTLILLIDFKTNGNTLWPFVQDQLQPLRSNNYLTYFNGSTIIQGPLTIVATGNAPFHKVIANTTYRDIFFDAPLPELAKLAPLSTSPDQPSTPKNQPYDPTIEQIYLTQISNLNSSLSDSGPDTDQDKGQGYSGHQPADPAIYTRYNSYYASTSLLQNIGSPFPYLSNTQRETIKRQIAGAHIAGLQVRYWDTPAWPVSWRHYIWRELIQLGIDFLNVDDLMDATKGDWLSQGSLGKVIWGSGGW